jgi:hypothetical protein
LTGVLPNPWGSDVIRLPVHRPGVEELCPIASNPVEVERPRGARGRPHPDAVHHHVGGLPLGCSVGVVRASSKLDHGPVANPVLSRPEVSPHIQRLCSGNTRTGIRSPAQANLTLPLRGPGCSQNGISSSSRGGIYSSLGSSQSSMLRKKLCAPSAVLKNCAPRESSRLSKGISCPA